MKYVTTREMQNLEARARDQYGISTLILMENAGRTVAEEVSDVVGRRKIRILVLCGKGNNGGDGLTASRHLYNRGHLVEIILFGDPSKLKEDALFNFLIIRKMGIPLMVYPSRIVPLESFRNHLSRSHVVIDALFGTGLQRPLEPPYPVIIDMVNKARVRRISIDVPSGLNADSGRVMGQAIQADLTITLGYPKVAFRIKSLRKIIGRVKTGYISLPEMRR